jgi:hypothetical protein
MEQSGTRNGHGSKSAVTRNREGNAVRNQGLEQDWRLVSSKISEWERNDKTKEQGAREAGEKNENTSSKMTRSKKASARGKVQEKRRKTTVPDATQERGKREDEEVRLSVS